MLIASTTDGWPGRVENLLYSVRVLHRHIRDLIFSAHQATGCDSALVFQKLGQACGVDERIDTEIDDSHQPECIIEGRRTERLQAAQAGGDGELKWQPADSEARDDDDRGLDDVLVRFAQRF